MRRFKLPPLIGVTPAFILAAALAGCSKNGGLPTISITASPTTLVLGSMSNGTPTPITLTATGTDSGSLWVDSSVNVQFTTDWGNFDPPSDDDTTDNRSAQVAIDGHEAIQQLYPDSTPPTGGVAHVTATYIDTASNSVSATVGVTIQTASVASSLTFSCLSGNIGAFADQDTTMEIGCTAQAYNSAGVQVAGVPLSFMAEAGAIQYDSEYGTYAYFPFRSGPGNVEGNQPLDVMPIGAEPSYVDNMGKTRNPRDGLVTMVAYAPSNATNTGSLQGEPYLDVDDSGAYHAGDPFVDLNGNGTWDASQTSTVWVQTKILWTGSLQNPSPVMTTQFDPLFNGVDISDGVELTYPSTATLEWTLVDQNLNIVAANDPSEDAITWSCSPEPFVQPLVYSTALNPTDSMRFGMLMDGSDNLTDPGDSSSWEIGGSYSLPIANESTCPSTTPATATTFTCSSSGITRTLWLGPQGMDGDQISGTIETLQTVLGSSDPNTSASCSSE